MGGHPPGPLFDELGVLAVEGLEPADAGAEVNAQPLGGHLPDDAAVGHGLLGRRQGVLHKAIGFADFRLLQHGFGVEALDLGGQLGLILGRVEPGHRPDAVFPSQQALPEGGDVVADRGQRPHPGNYHASRFHSFCHLSLSITVVAFGFFDYGASPVESFPVSVCPIGLGGGMRGITPCSYCANVAPAPPLFLF